MMAYVPVDVRLVRYGVSMVPVQPPRIKFMKPGPLGPPAPVTYSVRKRKAGVWHEHGSFAPAQDVTVARCGHPIPGQRLEARHVTIQRRNGLVSVSPWPFDEKLRLCKRCFPYLTSPPKSSTVDVEGNQPTTTTGGTV